MSANAIMRNNYISNNNYTEAPGKQIELCGEYRAQAIALPFYLTQPNTCFPSVVTENAIMICIYFPPENR